MIITKEEALSLNVGVGRVLVQIPYVITPDIVLNNAKISLQAVSDEARIMLAARSGIVVSVHPKADLGPLNYSWDGPVEVEVGDQVWFTPDAIAKICIVQRDESFYFAYQDGEQMIHLLIVPYKELVLRKNDSGFLALNDYIVCKRVPMEKISKFIILEHLEGASGDEPDIFDVVYTPTGNIKYDWKKNFPLKSGWKTVSCEVGERVKTYKGSPVDLEFSYNRTMDPLVFIQSHIIMAKIDGE
jgi:hypothetical protein